MTDPLLRILDAITRNTPPTIEVKYTNPIGHMVYINGVQVGEIYPQQQAYMIADWLQRLIGGNNERDTMAEDIPHDTAPAGCVEDYQGETETQSGASTVCYYRHVA